MNQDFVSLQIQWMRKILSESLARLKASQDLAQDTLSRGVWYGVDYYSASKLRHEISPLEKAIQEGAGFHGHGSEEHLIPVEDPQNPTGRKIYAFKIKKGKSPSEAISRLEQGPSLLDCGNVCYLASYLALCDVWSPTQFDRIFSADGPSPFIITADDSSPLARFLPKKSIRGEKEVRKGDICYFSNCQEYIAKHPAGEARGFHVLVCSEDPLLYLGFGLSHEGLTREEIEYNLWQSFNEKPIDEAFYPPCVWQHLYSSSLLCNEKKSRELVQAFREKQLTWDQYQKSPSRLQSQGYPMDGKMGLWVYRPDLSLIQSAKIS